MIERRRPLFAPELLARVALAWVMICALMLVTNYGSIAHAAFSRSRRRHAPDAGADLLAGQSWFDVHQYRVDAAAGGVPMHWSRLVDVPNCLGDLVFLIFHGAIHGGIVAAVVVPLFTFGFARCWPDGSAWDGGARRRPCLPRDGPVSTADFTHEADADRPSRMADRLLALLAVSGLMARSPRLGGWMTGFALALWVSISVEGLPLAVAICGILRCAGFATAGAAAGSSMSWVRSRSALPLSSSAHAALPIWCSIAMRFRRFTWRSSLGARPLHLACPGVSRSRVLASCAGWALIVAGGAIVFFAAPQCAGGGFVALDPLVGEFWYRSVGEGMPVWQQSPALALQILVPPLIGLFATLKLAANSSNWLRAWWCDYALLLGASLFVALFVARAGSVAGALAAVPLGWQISKWYPAGPQHAPPKPPRDGTGRDCIGANCRRRR